jgi:hypothetical protein
VGGLDDEKLSYGALVGGCLRQPEGEDHALWANRKCHLEAVDPLGFGGAPPEGGLLAENSRLREALTLTMAGMRVVSRTW